MAGVSETAIAGGRLGRAGSLWGKFAVKWAFLFELFQQAFETEAALRRPFLWLPVSAGAGVVLYLYADREPSLWFIAPAAMTFGVLAYFAQANRLAFFLLCCLCALFAGELSAALRTARVAAPGIDRIHIATPAAFHIPPLAAPKLGSQAFLSNLPAVSQQGTAASPGSPGSCEAQSFGYGLGSYTAALDQNGLPKWNTDPAACQTVNICGRD
jgi:hypothetical protein